MPVDSIGSKKLTSILKEFFIANLCQVATIMSFQDLNCLGQANTVSSLSRNLRILGD